MTRTIQNRLAALLLASLMSIPAIAGVTTTTEVDAVAMAHDAFILTPSAVSVTRPLVIDSTPNAVVRVTAVSRTLTVALRSPNGTRFTVGDPETAVFTGARIDNPNMPNGATYAMILRQPVSGAYALEVTETVPLGGPLNVVVTTLFENSTRAMLIGGGETYPLGGNIRVAAVVVDALGKVQNLNVSARTFRPGDATFAPITVSFRDDGLGADRTGGRRDLQCVRQSRCPGPVSGRGEHQRRGCERRVPTHGERGVRCRRSARSDERNIRRANDRHGQRRSHEPDCDRSPGEHPRSG